MWMGATHACRMWVRRHGVQTRARKCPGSVMPFTLTGTHLLPCTRPQPPSPCTLALSGTGGPESGMSTQNLRPALALLPLPEAEEGASSETRARSPGHPVTPS